MQQLERFCSVHRIRLKQKHKMKTLFVINSPINNKYLSDPFGMDHDTAFTLNGPCTVDRNTLHPDVCTYSTRNKAYDAAKNQGDLHGFEPIVMKIVI